MGAIPGSIPPQREGESDEEYRSLLGDLRKQNDDLVAEYRASLAQFLLCAVVVFFIIVFTIVTAAAGMPPAIVKVQCGQDIGTGVVVAARGDAAWVLTVEHIRGGPPVVTVAGRCYQGKILAKSRLWDIALIGIRNPGVQVIPLAENLPRRGSPLWTYGLRTQIQKGAMAGWFAPEGSPDASLVGLTAARVYPGDSGGAIVNTRGRLVGVISGGSAALPCVGTCFPRIRRIFGGCLPRGCPPIRRPLVQIRPTPPPAPVVTMPQIPPRPPASEALQAQVDTLTARVGALEALLRGKLFAAQIVDKAGRPVETLDVSLGGTLPLRFESKPKGL